MLQSRMRRGEMDRQITFIKKVIGSNAFNEDKEESWIAVSVNPTVWARMRQTKGRDVVLADQLKFVQETVFTCDYRTDVTDIDHRLVYRGIPYQIISIIPNEESRDMYIDVVCQVVETEVWT